MTGKVIVMDHPLITHKINYVRQENVGTKEFREVIGEIAQLMCYEATRDLKMSDVQIKTPIMEMTGKMLSGKKLAIVPILRAAKMVCLTTLQTHSLILGFHPWALR